MTNLNNGASEDSYSNNQATNLNNFGQEFVILFAFERESYKIKSFYFYF